ncbi:unnamed protein product [Ixodes pacificus]
MPGSLTTVSYGANKVFGLSILALSGLLEVAPLTIHFGIHGLASIQFLNGVAEVRRVPWRCILTSTPVHLVCLALATGMYEQRLGKYNYLMYLGDFHRFPSLPSVLALAAVIVTCGVASDFLRDKVLLSTSVARKMSASGGIDSNHLDLAPQHAAVLKGVSSTTLWVVVGALNVFIITETSSVMVRPTEIANLFCFS